MKNKNVCPNIFIENWYKQISELYLWKIYLNILTYSSISDLHPHLLYNFWKAQGMTFEMALPWISHTIWNFIKTRVFSFCCRELSAGRSGLLLVKSVRVKSLIFYILFLHFPTLFGNFHFHPNLRLTCALIPAQCHLKH